MDEHDSTHELKDKLMKKLKDEFSRIKEELMLIVENYPDPKKDLSYIDECISKLFIDKVGKPYSSEKLEEICKDGLLSIRHRLRLALYSTPLF